MESVMEFITILAGSQLALLPVVVALTLWTITVLVGMIHLAETLLREDRQEVSADADADWSGWYIEDEPEDPPYEGILELTPTQVVEEATASLMALDRVVLDLHILAHGLDRVFDPAAWLAGEVALQTVESLYERLALDEDLDRDLDPGHGANLEFIGPMTAGGYWVDQAGRVRDHRGRFAPKAALKGGRSRRVA